MTKIEAEFYEKISKEIMRWDYLAKDKKTYDALQRLANSPIAKIGWRDLSNKPFKQDLQFKEDIFFMAGKIGRWTIDAYLDGSQKLTAQEIKTVSKRAIDLVSELKELILKNSILRFYGYDLIPEVEAVAYARIQRGLSNQALERTRSRPDEGEKIFSDDVENWLDELQARDHPEYKDITSSMAYRILAWRGIDDYSFLQSLDMFEKLVKDKVSPVPILPRPNKELADEHVYAIAVCESLNRSYGSPLFEISASFCSAVFDHDFEVDTIKKWWHRRPDSSAQI